MYIAKNYEEKWIFFSLFHFYVNEVLRLFYNFFLNFCYNKQIYNVSLRKDPIETAISTFKKPSINKRLRIIWKLVFFKKLLYTLEQSGSDLSYLCLRTFLRKYFDLPSTLIPTNHPVSRFFPCESDKVRAKLGLWDFGKLFRRNYAKFFKVWVEVKTIFAAKIFISFYQTYKLGTFKKEKTWPRV